MSQMPDHIDAGAGRHPMPVPVLLHTVSSAGEPATAVAAG